MDLMAALAQTQAKIDVLKAVTVRRVEASHRSKGVCPNQSTGAGDGLEASRLVDGRMTGGKTAIHVAGESIVAEDNARVLHRLVGIEQLGANDRCGRMP